MKANYENLKTINVSTAGTDLDNYINDGTYFFNNLNTPTNKPSEVTINAGYLEVIARNSNDILQRWTEYNRKRIWQREKAGGTWGSWALMAQEKSYMVVGNTGTSVTTTGNWGRQTVDLSQNVSNQGSTFTLENGKIKVNRNCIARISANATMKHDANKYGNLSILNNNTVIAEEYNDDTSSNWVSRSLSPKIVKLNKNDVISLCCGSNTSNVTITFANWNYTYLTVEEIG